MTCPVGGEAAAQPANPCIAADALVLPEHEAPGSDFELEGESWRQEVAARLQRYRTRRKPRPPRYPSLRLPFESPAAAPGIASPLELAALEGANALAPPAFEIEDDRERSFHVPAPAPIAEDEPELFSNIIEFPRSAAVPLFYSNALAEPILDRPRIVEAPEVLPPPPALGGILMDSVSIVETESKRVSGAFVTASLPIRVFAGVLDGLILAVAVTAFWGLFYWLNALIPSPPVIVVAGLATWATFWAGYQFLFVVYSGATPGMRLARLRLITADGQSVSRNRRRWRVLASYLSVLSLGLGYLWSLLDEDALCWHDRMTRTSLTSCGS